MLTVATAHYLSTLADTKKGSLTNRSQAAKEHFKNDLKTGLAIAVPVAATGVVVGTGKAGILATKTGSVMAKVYKYVGKALNKLGATKLLHKSKLGKFSTKVANLAKDVANTISKNPKKYGAIGLAVAGALYLTKVLTKYSNKAGRIDQKYEDAAKIESQTKNVVLTEKELNANNKAVFIK